MMNRPIRDTTFERCLNFVVRYGKTLYGDKFYVAEVDYPLLYKLLVYFLDDRENAEKESITLGKGILLNGRVGAGKTALMTVMRHVQVAGHSFFMKSCRDVSFEFIQDGYEVINRYSRMSYNQDGPKAFCFDDLGAEQSLKYFGNTCNVMSEVILSRYEQFVSSGMITHITTNLNAKELQKFYGERVRSRLREMTNLIAFDPNTPDKRC